MNGLRQMVRRWQIERYETHRFDLDKARARSSTMLGAYGLTELGGKHSASSTR